MTVMTSWDLFDDLRGAQEELLRQARMPAQWTSGQFGQQRGASSPDQAWAPAVDITERPDDDATMVLIAPYESDRDRWLTMP